MKLMRSFNKTSRIILIASLTSFLAACGGGGDNSTSVPPVVPSVVLTVPASGATAVVRNTGLSIKFNQDMLASTINTTNIKLNCPAITAITGTTVTYDSVSRLAILTQQTGTSVPATTLCEARVTTAVKNSSGIALASDYVWSFTTGASSDTTAPTVTAHSPLDTATVVCLSKDVTATFSEAMDATTINSTTFNVTNSSGLVAGIVSYDLPSNTATFSVTNPPGFNASTLYTTHITTGVKDLAGNALASNNTTSFTTGTQICTPSTAVNLRTISTYSALGGGAGATNQGINTTLAGDLGTTAACTLITGFHKGSTIYTETGSNIGAVSGVVNCGPGAPGSDASLALAVQARADAVLAYNALEAETPSIAQTDQLGGLTLPPGIYKSTAEFLITTGNLTLDAGGDPAAVWVFQAPTALTVGLSATTRSVLLTNGAVAGNVFWQVGSAARIEDGSTMVGTILAQSGVTISTVGQAIQTTLVGRAIGIAASVTMVNTTITAP